MAVDALASCVAWTSAPMILTMWNRRVLVIQEEGFPLPVPCQIYLYVQKKMACKELIVLYCNVLHCTACLTRGRISITYTMSDTLSVQLINLARKELIVLYRNVLHCTVALCSHDVFYENPNNFFSIQPLHMYIRSILIISHDSVM